MAWSTFVRDGRYALGGLPAGTYVVQARRVRGAGNRTDPDGDLGEPQRIEIRGSTQLDLVLPGR